ncbi:MAG: DUF4238 domain-containing protein [Planctomycetes bacterium]|nr:DUF4238 domain-containing protein [Planctomycetota bacterium]
MTSKEPFDDNWGTKGRVFAGGYVGAKRQVQTPSKTILTQAGRGGLVMGYHYVPQKYLSGFSDQNRPGFVWQYDKKERRFSDKPVSIRRIAQQRGFYDEDVERKLNELVERPGNRAIEKLRSNSPIADEERVNLAIYIATMVHRVPRHRERAREIAPRALTEAVGKLKSEIVAVGNEGGIDDSIIAEHLAEVDAADERCRETPPPEIIRQFRAPWASERIVGLIYAMSWRFVSTEGPTYFLTSDNPVFFFESHGLGSPESELTFALSSNLALLGSWRSGANLCIMKAKQQLVKEVNRRLASAATRFLFYHERKEWVATIADKKRPYLRSIRW